MLEADLAGMLGRRTGRMAAGATGALRHGPLVLAALLGALCLAAARDLWRAGAAPPPVSLAPIPAANSRGAQALVSDTALVARRHLFGAVQQSEAPPATRAALLLGGIWYAPDGDGYALIGAVGESQRPYRSGDRLPGGVELESVHADHVLLRRAGRTEKLSLPRAAPIARPAGRPPNSSKPR